VHLISSSVCTSIFNASHNTQVQAFIGDASVASQVPWTGSGGAEGSGSINDAAWFGGGGGSSSSRPRTAATYEQGSRGARMHEAGGPAPSRSPGTDGYGNRLGAYTCESYVPGRDALPANATLIRRLVLPEPEQLPGSFSTVLQPSVNDIVNHLASRFNIPAANLRLARSIQPSDADRVDALGMRHVRLEQVQEYMNQIFG